LHYQHYDFLEKLEMGICIKEEFRNLGIGKYCYDNLIRLAFEKKGIKSIHLSIREDNIKSRMLAEKCGFKLYKGYKCDQYFVDLEGNKIPQVQYLLKKKDYIKKY
jgi:RimJ/RimL family protein N-acetyltransferase